MMERRKGGVTMEGFLNNPQLAVPEFGTETD